MRHKKLTESGAKRAIILGGCLATAYTQLTTSPATVEYARSLGASELHIGILGALPTGMLFMQFLAAVIVNHLRYRRWVWFTVSVVQRMIYLPVALGPWLWPDVVDATWLFGLILLTAGNHGLLHFCSPLWLSWMGDYLPPNGLNRFWGSRQLWMQWAAAASLFAAALFLVKSGIEIRPAFAVMLCVASLAGLADICLFLFVEEPPVAAVPQPTLRTVFAAPFQDGDFRTFIRFTCFWNFAAMLGAPFISLFLLSYVRMELFQVLMLWTLSWVGGAVFARRLGDWTETYGHRPVLILCTALKSTNMLAFLLTPRDPQLAFWLLVPAFMLDAMLNTGIAIASNGFMLKNSPAHNRTMFIAAGTALAGMIGCATSIGSGGLLTATESCSLAWGDSLYGNFHLVFALSFVMRLIAIEFARRIREPHAASTPEVVMQLIGAGPLQALRFPVSLYRSLHVEKPRVEQSPAAAEPQPAPLRRAA
jgi:hypothetical protein